MSLSLPPHQPRPMDPLYMSIVHMEDLTLTAPLRPTTLVPLVGIASPVGCRASPLASLSHHDRANRL